MTTARPRARRRFGQHFLEPGWVKKVIEVVAPLADDLFLEIGPGTGALTLPLAKRVAHIIAIEIDRDLAARLTPRLPPNVTLLRADALNVDLASVLADATARFGPAAGGALRAVGNLPYNVASPILFRILDFQRADPAVPFTDATLMLQAEVAARLEAQPGSKDYGVLTILTRLHATATRLLTLPPGAFRPMPAVTSAVVRLEFHRPSTPVADRAVFEHLVRSIFTQRRKTLRNALRGVASRSTIPVDAALAQAGLDPRRRPETLEMLDLARLAEVFASARQ